jgi:hypothetical protein
MRFLIWLLLVLICWPLALVVLVLYPIAWLVLLPFRVVGMTMDAVLALIKAILFLPSRILGGSRRY